MARRIVAGTSERPIAWDGAKDKAAWMLIVRDGPGTSTRVEEAK
jgi:hypothetical protein